MRSEATAMTDALNKVQSNRGSAPVCCWCGAGIPLDTPYRGEDLTLPPMVGVIVCTPACPDRPEGMKVYTHPDWRNES